MKEIDELNFERIRKRSEKINLNDKSSHRNQNDKQTNNSDMSDDYIDLKDCISKRVTFKDFNIVKLVGKGSFGKVFLVTGKKNNEFYAMKALKKDVVLQDDDVECTMLERDVCKLGHKNPYLTKLFCTFQNEVSFYAFFFSKLVKLNFIIFPT